MNSPNYNVAIECQGIQHFYPTDFAGRGFEWANNLFVDNKHRDEKKKTLCVKNGVKLLYFSTFGCDNDEICNNKDELLKLIINE